MTLVTRARSASGSERLNAALNVEEPDWTIVSVAGRDAFELHGRDFANPEIGKRS